MTLFGPPRSGEAAALPRYWTDGLLKKVIVVHLDTDQSIQGALMEALNPDQPGGALILRAAKLLDKDTDTPLAGEQIIPLSRVVWAQLDE